MAPSRAHPANAALLTLLVSGSVLYFPRLPERIPRHFGASGQPDAWWEATLLHWLSLPLLALVTAALLYSVAWLLGRHRGRLQVPNQARFDTLKPAAQNQILALVQSYLYWTASILTLLFISVQLAIYQVALGYSTLLPTHVKLAAAGALMALLAATIGLIRTVRHRVDELYTAHSGQSRA